MNDAPKAIAAWLGAMTGEAPQSLHADAGVVLARYVLGSDEVAALRGWFGEQPDAERAAVREALLETCIHMAHADRDLHPAERELIERAIEEAQLGPGAEARLRGHLTTGGVLPQDLATRLAHPTLREMALALAWELALADDRVRPEELTAHASLVTALGVTAERAAYLRDRLSLKV